jgi:hypothetical protein
MPDGRQTKTATFARNPCPELVTTGTGSVSLLVHEKPEAVGFSSALQTCLPPNEGGRSID